MPGLVLLLRTFVVFISVPKVLTLLEGDYKLEVTRVDVLEGEDSEKKIKQMKTFSGANTVPQVCRTCRCCFH